MKRLMLAVGLAVVLISACKQKPKEEETMGTTAATTTTTAAATATAAPSAEPAAAPAETIPPPIQPSMPAPVTAGATKPAAAAAKAESIAGCCSALHKEATETPKDKGLYQTAATSCDAISKLVSAGTTKKAAALTQLRANLRGNKLPAGCE